MAVKRNYSSNAVDTTLASSCTSASTTITVSSTTGFPGYYPYTLAIGYDTSLEELVNVVGASGTTLTLGKVIGTPSIDGRGVDSTTAQDHAAGVSVKHVISGRDLRETQEHYNASTYYTVNNGSTTETFSLHGIASGEGSVVGTDKAQALFNKTISGASNTLSNIPASAVSGTAITQTDTNTVTNGMLAGSIADTKLNQITTANKVNTSAITGTLAVANGGTGVTSSTGSGSNVLNSGATMSNLSVNTATINSGNLTAGSTVSSSTISSSTINTSTVSDVLVETGASVISLAGVGSYTLSNVTKNFTASGTPNAYLTLPSAVAGKEIRIINKSSSGIVYSASNNVYPRTGTALGNTICAAGVGQWALLVADGTNWYVMAGS